MINKSFLGIFLGILTFESFSQSKNELKPAHYFAFQTGLNIDNFSGPERNSRGIPQTGLMLSIRTFIEYQKDIKGNWQYGISFEHTFPFTERNNLGELSAKLNLLSGNFNYKINLIKDALFWTSGVGIGIVHANYNGANQFGGLINFSMTLNLKLSKQIYIETSPLLILFPFNRFYLSSMNAATNHQFFAYNILPFGLKIKL